MYEQHQGEQTIYNTLKQSPRKRRRKRRSELDQYEVLKPWDDEEDEFQGYLIRKRLFADKASKIKLYKTPSTRSFVCHHQPIMVISDSQIPHTQKSVKGDFHLPSLVSLEVPKEKKETSVQLHREDDIKRSQSLPLIHRPKKSLFQQKRSLGMGDLRQQKIKELKDCINSQILRMDDFQSLKSKILKI